MALKFFDEHDGPDVTIVIPTFNREKLLSRTLDSVIAQTHSSWECIVVDDGSEDGTRELLSRYSAKDSRIRVFHRPPDRKKGANACRNIAIGNAKGFYVTFLDSDDNYLPEHLQIRLQQLRELRVDASHGAGYLFDGKTRSLLNTGERQGEMSWFDYVLRKTIPINSLFLKREIAAATLFDETLLRHQDWDFLFRLPATISFAYCDTPTYVVNWVKHEKRTIHFPSCIAVYERHRNQLSPDNFLRQYLLGMYEKAVTYRATPDVVNFYRNEIQKHRWSLGSVETFKLKLPGVYRTFRSLLNLIR